MRRRSRKPVAVSLEKIHPRHASDKIREQPERSQKERSVISALDQAFDTLIEFDDTPRANTSAASASRTRKKGAGPPPALTDDEIARGREIFRDLLRENPVLRKATRPEQVRQVKRTLRVGRQVSDDTYLRHIIRPVVGRKHNKAQ